MFNMQVQETNYWLPTYLILNFFLYLKERAAQAVDDQPTSSGLDMMGGLKFMLRSRSFLLRAPFHKKNTNGRSRSRGNDSPFR